MSWLSSFLHPQRGYDAAKEEAEKYYNQGQGYLQPYNQNGQNAGNKLMEVMQSLMDPEALYNKWSSGYKESAAAKAAEGMANEHGLNAASSMGLMGGSVPLQAIQAGTADIVAGDKKNYMDDLMQKLMGGAGIGQNIYGQGANAAGQMSANANNHGNNASQLAYGQKNAQGDLFGNIGGVAGGLLGGLLGPAGSVAGGALGKWLTGKLGGK